MATPSSGPGRGAARSAAENDVYTVLMAVAFLFALVALVYVGYRAISLFGSVLPPPGS
jgi:hypothetical protein